MLPQIAAVESLSPEWLTAVMMASMTVFVLGGRGALLRELDSGLQELVGGLVPGVARQQRPGLRQCFR